MRKFVKCSNPDCDATFCIQLSDRTLDIVRNGQQFTVTGKDYDIIGTCWRCDRKSSITVEDGKIIESGVSYKDAPTPRTPQPEPPKDPEPLVTPPVDPEPVVEPIVADPTPADDRPDPHVAPVAEPDPVDPPKPSYTK